MHLVILNLAYRPELTTPELLLDRFRTLPAWAEAVLNAARQSGVADPRVTVVQRFGVDAELERAGVLYRFVGDGGPAPWRWWRPSRRVLATAASACRDVGSGRGAVVHVHGLGSGAVVPGLCRRLPAGVPVLVQHHAELPARGFSGVLQRRGLRAADGFLFAARGLSQPWRQRGAIRGDVPVFEVMEGSTDFRPTERDEARRRTGLSGAPLLLWVGRLDANKDPLTVLTGFEGVLRELPGARLAMAYGPNSPLLGAVESRVAGSAALARTVRLLGTLPHSDLESVYNSADLFVLGSYHEGSGFALAEALACGVVPVVTDIPSFRMMTGGGTVGTLWPPGRPDALAEALRPAAGWPLPELSAAARALFDERLSWPAIGRAAVAAYVEVLAAAERRAGAGSGRENPS